MTEYSMLLSMQKYQFWGYLRRILVWGFTQFQEIVYSYLLRWVESGLTPEVLLRITQHHLYVWWDDATQTVALQNSWRWWKVWFQPTDRNYEAFWLRIDLILFPDLLPQNRLTLSTEWRCSVPLRMACWLGIDGVALLSRCHSTWQGQGLCLTPRPSMKWCLCYLLVMTHETSDN